MVGNRDHLHTLEVRCFLDSSAWRKLIAGSWSEAGNLAWQVFGLLVSWVAVWAAVLVAVSDSFQVVLMDIQVAVGVLVEGAEEHIAFEPRYLVEYCSSVKMVAYLGHFPET